ncbi:hypothetical protein ATK17_3963 [Branchiibius hedensis]|uniref:Uncharacterized protein n=1 Tax=Branchiibius hedensis TaxID=672460 RepID=A0A2Y9BN40_9MICO|nr:hypothetical protein ATK17_3963 [Branchiibius hedensis]SSA59143.1 hypothetical protein SAMN04489750_3963 [Branchiibius hedensis]
MTNTCDCSRACGDAFACTECARTAGHNLAQIAQLADCLDGKRARQRTSWNVTNLDTSRRGTGWRTDSGQRFTIPRAHQPFAPSAALAYDSRVTATQDRVKNALVGMARLVIEADRSIAWPADNSHAIALWLMPYVIRKARFQEWASEMFTEVHGIREELLALLDNPPPTIYLGRCDAEIDGTPCPNRCTSSAITSPRSRCAPSAAPATTSKTAANCCSPGWTTTSGRHAKLARCCGRWKAVASAPKPSPGTCDEAGWNQPATGSSSAPTGQRPRFPSTGSVPCVNSWPSSTTSAANDGH